MSSFKIYKDQEEKDRLSVVPPWERDLQRALLEAKQKLKFTVNVKVRASGSRKR